MAITKNKSSDIDTAALDESGEKNGGLELNGSSDLLQGNTDLSDLSVTPLNTGIQSSDPGTLMSTSEELPADMLDDDQKECITVLGYLFLQNNKPGKSFILFRMLHRLFPEDVAVLKLLIYTCLVLKEDQLAYNMVENMLNIPLEMPDKIVGYMLKSKALWAIGRQDEARRVFNQFVIFRDYYYNNRFRTGKTRKLKEV